MSDPAIRMKWIQIGALIIGICFGAFAVASPSWVWLRKQIFSVGAGWLATLGTVLIGSSVWSSIEVSAPGFSADLKSILNEVRARTEEISKRQEQIARLKNHLRRM